MATSGGQFSHPLGTNYDFFQGLKKGPLRLLKPPTMILFVALKKAHSVKKTQCAEICAYLDSALK